MKRIPALKHLVPGVILLCYAMLAPLANAADGAMIRTANGISHVSGGVGDESMSELGALTGNFNLKLLFAMNSGNYVSDVNVNIMDAAGNTMLETNSDGPLLMARLPQGKYQIAATFAGNTIKRQVSLGTAPLRTIDFRWASE